MLHGSLRDLCEYILGLIRPHSTPIYFTRNSYCVLKLQKSKLCINVHPSCLHTRWRQRTQCRRHSKLREKRSWWAQTTFLSSSDGRRRHAGGIASDMLASELRKHPKHGFKC